MSFFECSAQTHISLDDCDVMDVTSVSLSILLIMLKMTSILFLIIVFGHFSESIRIFCLILTIPSNLNTRARAINATWAQRCDRFLFITELPFYQMTFDELSIAKQLPIAPIDQLIQPGYNHLTNKVTLAFQYVFEQYPDGFDWIIKADDDTYLLIDHLREFLNDKNPSEPVTFGYNFKILIPHGYHSGGAAYVLSRESLRRFSFAHRPTIDSCRNDGGSEDVEIARCLRQQGVYPGVSIDEFGRERFHPLPFPHHFRGFFPPWMYSLAENPLKNNFDCCSERSISFHYVSTEELYLMDFLYESTKEDDDCK